MNKAIPFILVVDDAPDNLLLAGNLLTPHYRVKLAASGKLALEIAQAETPDLILLDVMMPGMNGYETCDFVYGKKNFRSLNACTYSHVS